jgi:hypothetical protein
MYRDDDLARDERATALIDEIARLERDKIAHAAAERRLEDARRELQTLQPVAEPQPTPPGLLTHVMVFAVAAAATFVGYTLLF